MFVSPEEAAERAVALSHKGFNCSESVLQVLLEIYGIDGDATWTAASGFGGGIGRLQSVCGAVTGGVIALGLREAMSVADPKAQPNQVSTSVRPKVQRLVQAFEDRFGSIECGTLLAPHDFKKPGGYEAFHASGIRNQTCCNYVKFVTALLAKEEQS